MLDRLFTLIDQERYDDALALENEFQDFPDDESVEFSQVVRYICTAILVKVLARRLCHQILLG